MEKRVVHYLCVFILMILVYPAIAFTEATPQVKLSVFNFGTMNLEASGYNTTVTNMLINTLSSEPSFSLTDRKELENFLSINDLQQDDNLENVVSIGSRLGLNVIVVGNVRKNGSIIIINCKVVNVEQKRVILDAQARSLGDAGLMSEIRKLSTSITTAISSYALKQKDVEKKETSCPVNVQKRSGNKRVYLSWEDPPGVSTTGYEIFRGNAESGPFVKIAQVNRPEHLDQDLDRNTIYYYKIRAFSSKGIQSDFSAIISAETALTPNPPVILRTEGHVKSIEVTWSPGPITSEDPLKLKGYKLYRAKTPQGPFKEVANILGKDIGIGVDSTTTLDKLFKVTYVDRGLADGEDYYYKVTAYNEKNLESDFSTCIKSTTIPVVSSLFAQGDMIREIKLSWSPIDSLFIKGYYIFRSTLESGNFTKIKKVDASDAGSGGKLYYTDKEGLGDKTRYFYRITAIENPDAETSPSVAVSAVTKGKPPTPQGLKAQNGLVKKVEVTWMVSPYEEVEGYNLYWSKEKVGKYSLLKRIDGRTINSFSHGGGGFEKLDDNTTYYYTITTFNKVDVESDLSETAFAATKPRPTKPTGLKGDALKVKEVPLTWLPNPEKDIAVYHIYRATGSEEDYSRITKVQGKTSYQDQELKDGYAYRYRIQAEDKDELFSDFSNTITIQTKPKPKSPEGLTAEVLQGKVELTWKAGNERDISHYNVYEKRFFGLEKIHTVKITNFSEAGPVKGKSKAYAVTSVDKDGLESEPSQEVTISGK
jgi:fibronectin type 3 domain-containing protein/TolB-like protein